MRRHGPYALRSVGAAFPTLLFGLFTACGCAQGVRTAGVGGEGGTSSSTGGDSGGTGGIGGQGTGGGGAGGGGAGGGGAGGDTTTSTTTTSTSTTTSTGTMTTITCSGPPDVAGYAPEVEPNAIAVQATPFVDGTNGFVASICPLADIDVFEIPVTAGMSLRLEILDPGGACPPGAAPRLRLFRPNGELVAQDTNGGQGQCSLISSQTHGAVASLPAGTYHAQIENMTFTTIDAYVLDVSAKLPSCGDGLVQEPAGEQCDDGNVVSGDGCTADCKIEAACGDGTTHLVAGEQCDDGNVISGDGCSPMCQLELVLLAESEPNTQAMPDSLVGYEGAIGSIQPGSDVDWYSFEVTTPGSSVAISTSDGLGGCPSGADTRIWLYDAAGTFLADDDEDGEGACSLITPVTDPGASGLAVGTYKVKVEEFGNNDPIASYVLLVNVAEPGCGDGILQPGEQCDDANATLGDGCDTICQAEAPWEIEPNATLGTATPLWPGFNLWKATLGLMGDEDWFAFPVQDGQSVTLNVGAVGAPGSCPLGFDSLLYLFDSSGVLIAEDDDDGVDLCPTISPAIDPKATNLPGGTYFARVQPFGGNGGDGLYQLDVLVQ